MARPPVYRVINYRGPCRVINYFVTVMVIFFETTGGLCGT